MEQDSNIPVRTLKVDGGASANNFLVQFQADISDTSVARPQCIETTALGVAYLAGLAVGYWKNKEEIKKNWQIDRYFSAGISNKKRDDLLKGWKRAVTCALIWAEEE